MNYKKINKHTARNLFNNGRIIYLTASKVRVGSLFQVPIIKVNEDSNFDTTVNAFQYYNCNQEFGKTVNYFIED